MRLRLLCSSALLLSPFGCASAQAVKPPAAETKLTNAAVDRTPRSEGRGGTWLEGPLAEDPYGPPLASAPGARSEEDATGPALNLWDRCPFPQEAEKKDVGAAVVVARVIVREDGSAEDVEILRDPGHGFGDAARACAKKQLYVPARDADGKVVAGKTRPFVIRFMR
jgi:protein TonB